LANYRKASELHVALGGATSEDLYLRYHAILVHAGIGEMQARLGEHRAAQAQAARAGELAAGIAADPSSAARSSLRGQVYMRIAAIHAALGASATLARAARREQLQAARARYAQSLAIWQDMKQRGILTAEDRTRPQDAAAAIARCDESLRALDVTS
jgi:hypothetical protein